MRQANGSAGPRGVAILGLGALLVGCPASSETADGAGTGGTASDTGSNTGSGSNVTLDTGATDNTGAATSATSGTTSDTLDTGPLDTGTATGPAACMDHSDCTDPDNPICVDGTCTTCNLAMDPDAACGMVSPDTPACVDTTCVECSQTASACDGNTPRCDLDTSTCVPCTEHAHCPDSACKIPSSFSNANDSEDDEGACFSGAIIDLTNTDSLASQIAMVPDGTEQVFRLADGTYDLPFTVDGGKSIALLAATPGAATLNPGIVTSPTITVTGNSDGTRLFIHGVDLRGNLGTSAAIAVSDSRLHAQRSRIVQNSGEALHVEGGAYVDVENSFLIGNANVTPAAVVDASSVGFLYSSLARAFNNNAAVIECSSPLALVLGNSVVVSEDGTPGGELSMCTGSTEVGSTVESTLDPASRFVDLNSGDLHLVAGHPFGDVATWHDGDPLVDIDGDARPGMDGMADVAGADIGP